MDLTFLKSTRFWAIVIIAVVGYLEMKGWIGEAEKIVIWTIAGGFGIVRTVDRIGDKIGE
jgi:hypothetical protein